MKITEVITKASINEFIKLPFKIYANDKNWIPHLKQDIEKVFDPKQNKAHANGVIKRWILKDSDQKTIGRIAAFIDFKEKELGGVGFFECIEHKEAAFLLLDTAKNWLHKNGAEMMDGPINFGEKNMFWGLLIDNFIDPNSYGMNYNPPYYRVLFEEYGFQVYYKQFMYKRDIKVPVQEVFEKKYNTIIADKNYRISNVEGVSIEEIGRNFRTVYNAAWGGHDNFKVMTEKTAQKIMKSLKPIYDPKIIVFVFYKEQPIAFYVNIPELNEIFKHVNGNLNLLGKMKFLYHKLLKTPKTMVGIVFGVDRDYHGKGVEGAMIKWSELNIANKTQYEQTVLTWVGDFNPKMLKVCENLGADIYRTYHTYRYLFDREKPFERCPIVN